MANELTIQAKTPAMMRREWVRVPAVMAVLGPVEKAVFLASTAKTVAEYTGAELSAELAVALKWICKDVGYRPTDDGEMQYLVIRTAEILKRYYSDLTLKDFRMAFEMSITGELDEFLPKGRDGQPDKNHYQQFNAEYVCKILNAYRGRRGWIIRKAREAVPQVKAEPDAQAKAFYRNESRKQCINAFYHFKYRGYLPALSPIAEMLCYEMLSAVGLADVIVVTVAEQNAILERTVAFLAGSESDISHVAFSLARRKALERTFGWMAENEIQITDYIRLT